LNILAIKQFHKNYHLKKGDSKFIRHTNIDHEGENLLELCKNQFNVSKMLKEERIEANSCTLGSFSTPILIISLQKSINIAMVLKGKHKITTNNYKWLLNVGKS
jgi:hypothetical protein